MGRLVFDLINVPVWGERFCGFGTGNTVNFTLRNVWME